MRGIIVQMVLLADIVVVLQQRKMQQQELTVGQVIVSLSANLCHMSLACKTVFAFPDFVLDGLHKTKFSVSALG